MWWSWVVAAVIVFAVLFGLVYLAMTVIEVLRVVTRRRHNVRPWVRVPAGQRRAGNATIER